LDGNDSILGNEGNDTLDGGAGNDTMSGGAGNDFFIVDSAGDRVSDSAGTDTILLRTSSISLAGILVENVTGGISGQAFSITGNSIANVLTGGALADTINASTGDDTIFGGDGNDNLTGGAGNDLINGGAGLDWANYAELTATSQAVTVNLVTGRAVGAAGADTLAGIENILTGAGNDSLLGDSLGNMLSAGLGNDTLNGGTGNDTLDGGAGNDSMTSSSLIARATGCRIPQARIPFCCVLAASAWLAFSLRMSPAIFLAKPSPSPAMASPMC
jgi:serralysin